MAFAIPSELRHFAVTIYAYSLLTSIKKYTCQIFFVILCTVNISGGKHTVGIAEKGAHNPCDEPEMMILIDYIQKRQYLWLEMQFMHNPVALPP
ncbi:MAG: hypothetical protein JJT82_10745 [Legionellaceae bacterium]|nr:hypothetical protein [Legionellaceae bacterium]